MKEKYGEGMEFNIEPRLNVDEQQGDKTFKVKSNIDDSDEVQKITATRTPIKSRSVCFTWNQKLALKNGCKKLKDVEHTELW